MPATYKRIIEERLVHEIFSGDYFVKDHATEGTTRILVSEFIDLILAGSASEEDLETVVHNFVSEYDSGTSYSVGNYCIYLNELYRCTTATTGNFDDSDWTATNAMSELVNLVSAEATARTTTINNEAYYRSMSDIVLSEDIAEPYNTTKSYVVGDIVSYNLYIYRCTGATTGTWDASKWEQVTVDELFDDLNFSAEAISYDNTSSGLEAENVQDAIDETITKLSAVGSASGDIATFPDGSDLPMPKLEVAIEPVQDLHGYDAPWVGGAGKNKLPYFTAEEKNGIRLTYDNGVVVLNGTASANTFFTLTNLNLASNTYTFSANNNATNNNVHISLREIGAGSDFSDLPMNSSDKHNTYQDVSIGQVTLYVLSGTQLTNFRLPLQIEVGGSKTTFASYSNICPISGWDEVNVTVADDVETPTVSNVYTLDLDGTRYGGKVDLVSGVMTVDRAMVDLGTLNWSYTSSSGRSLFTSNDITDYKHTGSNDIPVNAISECFKIISMSTIFINGQMGMDGAEGRNRTIICDNRYTDATAFTQAMSGVQLVYELATPLTIQLTPTVVKSLRGKNNVFADSGAILDAEYIRDLTTIINYILEQLNA